MTFLSTICLVCNQGQTLNDKDRKDNKELFYKGSINRLFLLGHEMILKTIVQNDATHSRVGIFKTD